MKSFIPATGQRIAFPGEEDVKTSAERAATEYIQRLLPIRVVVTDKGGREWECEVGYARLPPSWETLRIRSLEGQ